MLFIASGAVLLVITYLLVTSSTSNFVSIQTTSTNPQPTGEIRPDRFSRLPRRLDDRARELRDQAVRQHEAQMHDQLVQSGIALAIMAVISIVLGWVVAGRVLRPLRTMTSSIRQISAHNVHERLAVGGPPDELKDLAESVDGLLGRLETALDSHKRFVSNAAHELRTPLTLEHALLEESLIDRHATLESFRSNFERLLAISKQQGCLLESLLTLSSSERGVERSEPLNLSEITDRVLLTFRPEIDRRGLGVEATIEPAPIAGDSALVERLVANLLDNATNYNVPGGRVEILTGITAGRAVVAVANTGPDIPPEQVDRLFEPFQRLRRTAGDGHHGLGLSIVRAIANAHGATLTAHTRPDGGLLVEAAFPLRAHRPGRHGSRNPVRATAAREDGSFLVRFPEEHEAGARTSR
ncbi:sensor histidine kinase [Streptomyces sp. H27-D2]|uniref:sensor histidine kinase n=1 Tax=Streptomyces sp. H27-D2 TaxID=3046304 RepID=UPI002DB858D6|nr:ATP-binding protein [Streptomyces sp. H27-D2]MEC4019821.1 ATP-binding protein [Streptomyces sp. H27-D2]